MKGPNASLESRHCLPDSPLRSKRTAMSTSTGNRPQNCEPGMEATALHGVAASKRLASASQPLASCHLNPIYHSSRYMVITKYLLHHIKIRQSQVTHVAPSYPSVSACMCGHRKMMSNIATRGLPRAFKLRAGSCWLVNHCLTPEKEKPPI